MSNLVLNFKLLLLLCFLTAAKFWNLWHLQSIIRVPWFLVIWTSFRSDFNADWKKNQIKHSKFGTKFVICHPVEMTWSTHKNWWHDQHFQNSRRWEVRWGRDICNHHNYHTIPRKVCILFSSKYQRIY